VAVAKARIKRRGTLTYTVAASAKTILRVPVFSANCVMISGISFKCSLCSCEKTEQRSLRGYTERITKGVLLLTVIRHVRKTAKSDS